MLGLFVFLLPQQGGGGAANGGGRVRPAAPPVDDGGEQGKSADDFHRNTQFFIFRLMPPGLFYIFRNPKFPRKFFTKFAMVKY
uniref:Secreted protein n=1 Tax=Oryza rufipogon TaxID=4529 RepID=A0A0E0NKP6_ORYRU